MALTDYTSGSGGLFGDVLSSETATDYSNDGINYGDGGFFEQAKGIFGGVNDVLGDGLNTWINFEKAKGIAESTGDSQAYERTTTQTPSGNRQQPNTAAMAGLPGNLSGGQLLIAGGVVLLAFYLIK
ncbi:hypothetical protein [Chromohalobacter nigrandesensis]|uniref:hypothetical protein n=1 Tax=Chromohalobacter nigrandesensis TaxID=119863 RepID=UPI001FF5CD64|nr:hypothetical protein [Chromohalobacter nigrandesensis]MCK0745019.1 hypothetical protein [Chromohalobacter nigrandesensis]